MFSGLGQSAELWLWGNGLSELPAICSAIYAVRTDHVQLRCPAMRMKDSLSVSAKMMRCSAICPLDRVVVKIGLLPGAIDHRAVK